MRQLGGCNWLEDAPTLPSLPQGGWQSYEMLYNLTAHALLAVDPLLSVGGPATAQLGHITDFLNLTQSPGGPPAAFVSSHSYPTDYRHRNQSSLNRTLYEDYIFAAVRVGGPANTDQRDNTPCSFFAGLPGRRCGPPIPPDRGLCWA